MLTPRQREVVEMVAQGLSNKAVARELDLSVRTVEAHLYGASNRIPGDGRPRYKAMLWFFSLSEDASAV